MVGQEEGPVIDNVGWSYWLPFHSPYITYLYRLSQATIPPPQYAISFQVQPTILSASHFDSKNLAGKRGTCRDWKP